MYVYKNNNNNEKYFGVSVHNNGIITNTGLYAGLLVYFYGVLSIDIGYVMVHKTNEVKKLLITQYHLQYGMLEKVYNFVGSTNLFIIINTN